MITEKLITDAWVFLRTNNNSIPDEVLDFIKDASLSALDGQNNVKPVQPAVFLPEYDGQKKTKIRWDRTRDVIYNGNELYMNTYECSSCKTVYHFEEVKHCFCPFCGTKYEYEADISV